MGIELPRVMCCRDQGAARTRAQAAQVSAGGISSHPRPAHPSQHRGDFRRAAPSGPKATLFSGLRHSGSRLPKRPRAGVSAPGQEGTPVLHPRGGQDSEAGA